jgi:hypothetical protein
MRLRPLSLSEVIGVFEEKIEGNWSLGLSIKM